MGGISSHRPFEAHVPDTRVSISESEITQLLELWTLLRTSVNKDAILVALRRWDSAITRLNDEDRLIDYWVGLESLFSSASDRSELTFKYALRGAMFLGATPEKRIEIFERIKKSYNTRSKIVHGTAVNAGDLTSATENTRSYLRDAIVKILRQSERFEPDKIETNYMMQNTSFDAAPSE